jgi:hypothetical protein
MEENNKRFSPKLKGAMAEIKEILDKHDIAGFIVLHEVGFSEFMLKIDPSYSCAFFEGDDCLRVKAKAADYAGGASERDIKLADTSNMLHHLSETGNASRETIIELSKKIDELCNYDHFGSSGQTKR